MRLLLITCIALSLGCGANITDKFSGKNSGQQTPAQGPAKPVPNTPTSSNVVDTAAQLPECTETTEGTLVYISDAKVFRACSAGKWSTIDLKGEKGDPGQNGVAASGNDMNLALSIYKNYRRSVFRATLKCALTQPVVSSCQSQQMPNTQLIGTGFLCDSNSVCTNRHVVTCPTCYSFQEFALQATEGSTDSVNADGSPAEPFFSTKSNAVFKVHEKYDLAKFPVTNLPQGAEPLPLAAEAFATTGSALTPVLSLSFALGFQDLYVDVGFVNSKYIGECDKQGGISGYGCPRDQFDFSTTNDTDHGSSGSPLIDIQAGKVIGVTTAGTEGENANFTWAIDAYRITEIK